jgi:RNA polymerase sigma factor (sigma-70 family)
MNEMSLANRFEASRTHLQTVAYRLLGSRSEAEDAVQETWFRLARSGASEIANLRGWLTTVVARVCLDMLRARKSRREAPLDMEMMENLASPDHEESEAQLADSMGLALLIVLDTLAPAERIAFVLHDMFNLPFDEIAPVVNRTPAAARQLASRARRRVQGSTTPEEDTRKREIVVAFLNASRNGDFTSLLALLDPDVVLRADAAAISASLARQDRGAPKLAPEVRGGEAVARTFEGRASAAQPAFVDGAPGLVYAPGGVLFSVFDFVIEGGRITEISLVADPESIKALQVEIE